ncbi:CheY-like chemotaxis protein [Mycobacterium frederiksbergense]|uniref:CheY-like chemotaxis protein n=1 Tax=Mycolicibacterium frederiksbergense TaxID=117567 RepID=A0ABT6KTT3_9MYCO|nr:hypothetical protein [Mycolicibacterium frederiksbergense]MDH6194059.1 CheY-like chemotaxis protein [Mycolicibacterium frederiksbergense]
MSREAADDDPDNLAVLAELLNGGDLSATQQCAVHDAIADSMIEGATLGRESMLRLIELAAGRVTFDQCKTQALQAHTSTTDHELTLADADYAAGNTISGQELRERYGLP